MHPLLDLGQRPLVGHRGNSAHAPENTIESFRQAVALGVDALELDVHLSADGHVVVIHDPTLDRTTDGSGRVDRQPLSEIQRADAGARFTKDGGATYPYRGNGICVPTLDDVLRSFPDTPLLIEIKTAAASTAARQVIERLGAAERCIVASFDWHATEPFRGSGIPRGSSRRDMIRLLWRAVTGVRPRSIDFNIVAMPHFYNGIPVPVGGYVRILEPLGVPVHVWTVDDASEAAALRAKGVRGIISNDPGGID
jgi:glycerophosphoryl diester phosphodiesterase